jgi:Putative Ig domain
MRTFSLAAALCILVFGMAACADGGDTSPPSGSSILSLALTVSTTSALPSGNQSVSYSATISAFGGSSTGYTWSLSAGALPPGLVLQPTGTPDSTVSGIPTLVGAYSFTVQVRDSTGATASTVFSLSILPAPAGLPQLTIVTTSLPNGQQGVLYNEQITALGGTQTGYTWSIVSGAIPAGYSIGAGTPTASLYGLEPGFGSFAFTLRVDDSFGNFATQPFTLTVVPAGAASTATCYTTPVSGRILFIVDSTFCVMGQTGSGGTIFSATRNEVSACVSALLPTDEFDIVVYSDRYSNNRLPLFGSLRPAVTSNIQQALTFIGSAAFNSDSSTNWVQSPTLTYAYANYTNVAHMFFITASRGNDFSICLSSIAGWQAADPNRAVHVVSYVWYLPWDAEMQALAGIVGGSYFRP